MEESQIVMSQLLQYSFKKFQVLQLNTLSKMQNKFIFNMVISKWQRVRLYAFQRGNLCKYFFLFYLQILCHTVAHYPDHIVARNYW